MQYYVVAAHAGKREKERSGRLSGVNKRQRNENEENKMRNHAHHSSFKHTCISSAILLIILLYLSGRRKRRCFIFRVQYVAGWCPVAVLIGSMFFLRLLLNAVLDRRSALLRALLV